MNNKDIKLLIAEDDIHQIEIISMFLNKFKFNPECVQNGADAIKKIRKKTYDVIITDYKMPGASGLEVVKAAKEKDADTQVIVITGHSKIDIAIEALRLGAFDFIRKPFTDINMLINIIYRCAEKRILLSEKKLLNEKLKSRNLELEEALITIENQQQELIHSERLKALGVMSAGMAHELNNPMTFVSSNIQTMQKYFEKMNISETGEIENTKALYLFTREFPSILTSMHNGVNRITKIINGLRTFARSDGKASGQILISKGIDDAMVLCSPRLKNIKVVFEKSGEEKPVTIIHQHLVQAIVNILTNACDATENTAIPEISINFQSLKDKQILSIKDNGCGMEQKILTKIFNPFFTTKDVNKGMGIGLSITHGIIKKSGGSISAESEIKKGTTVSIVWPDG